MKKPVVSAFLTRSNKGQAVQPQMARGLKFWIWEEEVLYNLCSKNKGAVQLHCNHTADLHL